MKVVKLKGRLAHQFGEEFNLAIDTPAEAVRALCSQLPGFEAALKEGEYRVAVLRLDTETAIDEEALHLSFGAAEGVEIEPVVGGAKSGIGKVILGIVLLGTAFFFAPMVLGAGAAGAGAGGAAAGAGAAGAAGAATGFSAAAMAKQIGVMMILQGASSLLTPTPKAPQTADQKESYMLDGTGNLLEQGNPVPVVFGEAYVGSVVVSAGISSDEMAIADEEPVVEEVPADTPSDPVEWPGP